MLTFFIKFFGCERFVYNFYLNEKNQFYEKEIKPLGDDKKARNAAWGLFEETPLAELKKQYPFLKEADSQGIANAYMNLRTAYQKFYSGLAKLPKFHSRKTKNSYKNSMMKGSKNAKNYQDISWSTFVSKLEQKSQFRNCQVVKVDKFFASSQICNCCGFKNPDVQKFHLENWKCPQCGTEHQRDENAALNIRAEAIRVLRGAEENQEKTCSKKNKLSKDTDSVLSVEELANLALSYAQ